MPLKKLYHVSANTQYDKNVKKVYKIVLPLIIDSVRRLFIYCNNVKCKQYQFEIRRKATV